MISNKRFSSSANIKNRTFFSALCVGLLLLLAILPTISYIKLAPALIIREYLLTLLYILLATLLWRNRYTRVLSFALLIIWVTNVITPFFMWFLYDKFMDINFQIIINIYSTNVSEAVDFVRAFWQIPLLSLLILLVTCWLVAHLSVKINITLLKFSSLLFLLVVFYKCGESYAQGHMSDPAYPVLEKNIFPYASLNNLGGFVRAYNLHQELSFIRDTQSQVPLLPLQAINTGIETYVLVIGESARRNNLSLYGYYRDTSPQVNAEINNLYLFEQAIAPAPTTILALSAALSIKEPDSNDFLLLNNNIINLANAAGYETFWFSRQGMVSKWDTQITVIAQRAKHKEWLENSAEYDDQLLSRLDLALAAPGKKKLIVLHINGSHISACNKYPPSEAIFTSQDSRLEYEDCYDNSIHFTDKVLGDIFARLQNKPASVFYFSDHGLSRIVDDSGEVSYVHAAIDPTKEALEVPQFIWYSPALAKKARIIGHYTAPYPTKDNYYLLQNWLGISQGNEPQTRPPWLRGYRPHSRIEVVDTQLHRFNYQQLRSDSDLTPRSATAPTKPEDTNDN